LQRVRRASRCVARVRIVRQVAKRGSARGKRKCAGGKRRRAAVYLQRTANHAAPGGGSSAVRHQARPGRRVR